MFDRFKLLIGDENYNKLKNKRVMIIGLGGVGGYTVEALVRSGIEEVVLVDYDVIDITNINRQIIALNSTIGMSKTEAFKMRISDINPNCNVKIITDKIDESNIDLIGELKVDFVIDACDDIKAKKLIISYCTQNNISLISSMGTGKRLDPSKLSITTLDKTSYDPIAKILRKYVKDNNIYQKIYVLASSELPLRLNSSVIPSCIFVPAAAGLLIANFVIKCFIES